jgi:hypothetical protein
VEERGGHPALVKGTGPSGSTGLLRIDFPDYRGSASLESISWREFFEAFEANALAFLHQERTKSGGVSRFSRLVAREAAQRNERRGGRRRRRGNLPGGGRTAQSGTATRG